VNAGLLLAVFELSLDFFIGSDHLQQRASSHSHGNVMCGCGGVACLCRNIGGCIWCLGRAVVAGGYLIPPEEQYASYAAALERVGCAVRLYADGGTMSRPGDLQAGAQAILAQADELARAAGLPPTAPLVLLGHSRGAKTCALAAALSSSNGSSSGVGQQRQPRCVASLVLIRPGGRDRARPVVSARHKSRLERASRGRKPRVGPRRVSCGGSLVCIEKVSHKQ
jgi:hypothetical protein